MKKIASWVIVIALALSCFTAVYAADGAKSYKGFKDASKIHYKEAVDIMVTVGVIDGFPNGTFAPEKTVTRGQMAKMIAIIKNGGEDIGEQYKSECTFADCDNHWAAGYIAYCASEHIIDGRSSKVFDPDASVTGTEAAKMALTSLGYDSKTQGYVGEKWSDSVLNDAGENGLFKGLDSSFTPSSPCKRECAAQTLFNMLEATEVQYNSNKAVFVSNNKKSDNGDRLLQLYEDVFAGDLIQRKEGKDAFGNPCHSWAFEKNEVGLYKDTPAYEFIAKEYYFPKALSEYNNDLAKDLEKDPPKLVVNSVLFNGMTVDEGSEEEYHSRGDVIRMYEAEVAHPKEGVSYYDVVIEAYYPLRIKSVDTNVTEEEAKKGITAKLDLDMYGSDPNGFYGFLNDMPNTEIIGYDPSTYVEGAVIAAARNWNKGWGNYVVDNTWGPTGDVDGPWFIDSHVMDELTRGKIEKMETNFRGDAYSFVINGIEYPVNSGNLSWFDIPDFINYDDDYVFYGHNGYILAVYK